MQHPGAALEPPLQSGSVGKNSSGDCEGDEEEGMRRSRRRRTIMPERVLYSAGAAGPSVGFHTAQSFDAVLHLLTIVGI